MHRVLVTGAAGDIGKRMRQLLRGVYPVLRLSDVAPLAPAGPGEEVVPADLRDFAAVERLMEGVDGVIHLGGQAVEHSWDVIRTVNIEGTYNLFEAARRQGTSRVVFASTNHVMGFYRRDQRIDHRVPPRPDTRYGLSKAFGEALGALYADKYGLRVLIIRIGNLADRPQDRRRLAIWISPRDLLQLARIGLDHPDVRYEIVYGMSDNARAWWDNENALRLGYRPHDRAEDYADEVLRKDSRQDEVAETFQGGPFCSAEFDPRRR